MPVDSTDILKIVYYEPQYFRYSVTYTSWVKLFIADAHALSILPGFEGTQARFWLNHPIRWLQLVGTVVGVVIRSSMVVIEIDDGSGRGIALFLKGAVLSSIHASVDSNTCDVDVLTVVKAKGTLNVDHKGDLELVVEKISILSDSTAELHAWEERVQYRKTVLDIPWHLEKKQMRTRDPVTANSARRLKTSTRNLDQKVRSDLANQKAQVREQDRRHEPLSFDALDVQYHTQRSLKVVLLEYFEKHHIREFSVAQLRAVPELEHAVHSVAQQKARLRGEAAGLPMRYDELPAVDSTQKYRTLNACLVGLVQDGSIMSVDSQQGMYSVVGAWNLGSLLLDLIHKRVKNGIDVNTITVRDLWHEVRQQGSGYEGISKQMVEKLYKDI